MEVTIRSPFPIFALPRCWRWMEEFRNRVADDFSPKTLDEWVDLRVGSPDKTWGVYRDGELGGIISFQRLTPWLGTAHCTFRKDFWGRATTRPAIEQAFREMFDSGIGKLTFVVFSSNQAVRSLLLEFGAAVEGTYKDHTLQDGKPVDIKSMGLTREKFDAVIDGRAGAGKLDTGIGPVGKAEDADKHDHADAHAANAGDDGSALILQQ